MMKLAKRGRQIFSRLTFLQSSQIPKSLFSGFALSPSTSVVVYVYDLLWKKLIKQTRIDITISNDEINKYDSIFIYILSHAISSHSVILEKNI